MIRLVILIASALLAIANAPDPGTAPPRAISTGAFSLSMPIVRSKDDGVRISGGVCRKGNRARLSPSRVEIDRLGDGDTVVDKAFAYLPPLSTRPDQLCGHYAAKLATPLLPAETSVACIARPGRNCASKT